MSDLNKPADGSVTPALDTSKLHQAKPGVIDKGDVVATGGGEAFSGHISDIADGDD